MTALINSAHSSSAGLGVHPGTGGAALLTSATTMDACLGSNTMGTSEEPEELDPPEEPVTVVMDPEDTEVDDEVPLPVLIVPTMVDADFT